MEQVLTFDREVLDQLQDLGIKIDRTAHKTVVLTEDGQVLYSDLFQPQTLVALTQPDGWPASGSVSAYVWWIWPAGVVCLKPEIYSLSTF